MVLEVPHNAMELRTHMFYKSVGRHLTKCEELYIPLRNFTDNEQLRLAHEFIYSIQAQRELQ